MTDATSDNKRVSASLRKFQITARRYLPIDYNEH